MFSSTYDANGNPTAIVYPGNVEARTTYDLADRPDTLTAVRPGLPDHPLVTASTLSSSQFPIVRKSLFIA